MKTMKTMKTINTKQRLAGLKIRANYGGLGSGRHRNDMSESEWEADTESRKKGVMSNLQARNRGVDSYYDEMKQIIRSGEYDDNDAYQKAAETFKNAYGSYIQSQNEAIKAGVYGDKDVEKELSKMTNSLDKMIDHLAGIADISGNGEVYDELREQYVY